MWSVALRHWPQEGQVQDLVLHHQYKLALEEPEQSTGLSYIHK